MRQRVFTPFVASIFALGALLASATASADQLAEIRKKGQIVVGVLGTDEPNSFVDPKTRGYIGYEVDLATAVARKIGVKPVFKQVSVAARIPELQQGRVDVLAASLTHNREREAQLDFGLTHFVTGSKAVVKKDSDIKRVADLAGKRVVTVKGGTQEINLRRAVPNVQIVTFETTQQAFQAFLQGKGVAYENDEASLYSDLAKLGPRAAEFRVLPENLGTEPLAFGIRKGETSLKAVIDSTLRELEASGEAEKLYEKWWGQGSKLKFPKRDFRFESDKVGQ